MKNYPVKLSIVVPCYNEEETVLPLYKETVGVMRGRNIDFEMIFINDGSSDSTIELLRKIVKNAECPVRVVDFSRNFGKESGIYAGLKQARGEYTVIMDGDMQQSPDVVMQMYDYLEANPDTDCVAAVQKERHEGFVLTFFKNSFYRIINKAATVKFVSGASDFRMFRRAMVDAVLELSEYQRFSKGIFSYVGFHTYFMPYVARERGGGQTKWSFKKLLRYAFDGIIGFTTSPLKIVTWLGGILSAGALVWLICIIVSALSSGNSILGNALTACLIVLIGGLQLVGMGILGEYIGRSYIEIKNRPIYIARQILDSEHNEQGD